MLQMQAMPDSGNCVVDSTVLRIRQSLNTVATLADGHMHMQELHVAGNTDLAPHALQ